MTLEEEDYIKSVLEDIKVRVELALKEIEEGL